MAIPIRTSNTDFARSLGRSEAVRSWVGWGPSSRPRRVLLLLSVLWVLNVFDLGFTVLAHGQGALNELNPLARMLLPYGAVGLTLYKVAAVGTGSLLLWRWRSHPLTESALWFLIVVYVIVALRWHDLFILLHYIQQHGALLTQ